MSEGIPVHIDKSVAGMTGLMATVYEQANNGIAHAHVQYRRDLQLPHILASQIVIDDTAQEALRRSRKGEERSALVLGTSVCGDVPIEQIVEEFDTTTLLDIDTQITEKVLSNIPSHWLDKIRLVQADISGSAVAFGKIVEDATRQPSYDGFVNHVVTTLPNLQAVQNNTEVGGEYNFVSSHLLMTQLSSLPIRSIVKVLQEKYEYSFSNSPTGPDAPLTFALQDYKMETDVQHFPQLRRHTKQNGMVHFADTIFQHKEGQAQPMTGQHFMESMDRYFNYPDHNEWQFISEPSRDYTVASFVLEPKATQPA